MCSLTAAPGALRKGRRKAKHKAYLTTFLTISDLFEDQQLYRATQNNGAPKTDNAGPKLCSLRLNVSGLPPGSITGRLFPPGWLQSHRRSERTDPVD